MTSSIVIITHNRPQKLLLCLSKLSPQLESSDETIIIDNGSLPLNSNKNRIISKKFKQTKYFYLLDKNIPKARNIGIKLSADKSDLICFIDDDCIPIVCWLNLIKKHHNINKSVFAIQGSANYVPKKNLYNQITKLQYNSWLKSQENYPLVSYLDTKNISFKRKLFFSNALKFNTSFTRASDIDLGIQAVKKNLTMRHISSIKVFHYEDPDFFTFLKKRLLMSYWNSFVLNKKTKDKHSFTLKYIIRAREIKLILPFFVLTLAGTTGFFLASIDKKFKIYK